MKIFLLCATIFIITGCYDLQPTFEKDFYRKVSGLEMPSSYKVIESADNLEWLTVTTLTADHSLLLKYIAANKFKPFNLRLNVFVGDILLKGQKPNEADVKYYYYLWGYKGKDNWLYIVDIRNNLLWAQISYPDWGGT